MPAPEGLLKRGEVYNDHWGMTVRWESYAYHLKFWAKQGTRQEDGTILYMAEDDTGVIMPADGFEAGERFVEGSVKWDGCSHLNVGDENGYLHLCGAWSFRGVEWALREAFAIAAREVPSWDKATAGEWP